METTVQLTAGETTKRLVNYRTDGGVAVIEMCDPPANTYTYEMNRQLDEAILKARMDNEVYVIVMTGAGDKFFSAGANIKMLSTVDPTFKYYFCLHANSDVVAPSEEVFPPGRMAPSTALCFLSLGVALTGTAVPSASGLPTRPGVSAPPSRCSRWSPLSSLACG